MYVYLLCSSSCRCLIFFLVLFTFFLSPVGEQSLIVREKERQMERGSEQDVNICLSLELFTQCILTCVDSFVLENICVTLGKN